MNHIAQEVAQLQESSTSSEVPNFPDGVQGRGAEEKPAEALGLTAEERHEQELCTPCIYVNTKAGCYKDTNCQFCHLPHARKPRPRPCKATRIHCKQLLMAMESLDAPSEQVLEVTKRYGARSAYMRLLLSGRERGGQAGDPEEPPGAGSAGRPASDTRLSL